MDRLEYKKLLGNSTPVKCPNPDCTSEHFIQTIEMKKVSAFLSSTGKTEFFPVHGPIICVECHRPITDIDFGFTNKSETSDDTSSTG